MNSFLLKVVAVSGWVAALSIGIFDLPAKINSFFENAPEATENIVTWWNLNTDFTGSWTNEGDITTAKQAATNGSHLALRMKVYGGRIEGEIWSERLSDTIHPVILLGSSLNNNKLKAYMHSTL